MFLSKSLRRSVMLQGNCMERGRNVELNVVVGHSHSHHVLLLLDKEETINENGDTDSEPQHEEEFIVLVGTCCEPSYIIVIFTISLK